MSDTDRTDHRTDHRPDDHTGDRADQAATALDRPAPEHRVPDGVDDATVEAVGLLSKALETTERARGHLYSFHQLTGTADLQLGEAVDALRDAGHGEVADLLQTELVGRNVIRDRWTFQIVEDYDDGYWTTFHDLEREVRDRLTHGRRHLHEARMKEERRTQGHPDHTARPEPTAQDRARWSADG